MAALEQRGAAIIRRLPHGAAIAEVGVLIGALSEHLLCQRPDIFLTMIDNWQTADKQPEAYRRTRDVHANHIDAERVEAHRRQAEARALKFPERAHIVCGWSTEVARSIPDNSLDLVFLDADHSYEGLKADLAAWVSKVKPGGWIGGHDYGNTDPAYDFSGVKRAADEWASAWGVVIETDLNFTWFARI